MIAEETVLITKALKGEVLYFHPKWDKEKFAGIDTLDCFNKHDMFCRYRKHLNERWNYIFTGEEYLSNRKAFFGSAQIEWFQKRKVVGKYKNIW